MLNKNAEAMADEVVDSLQKIMGKATKAFRTRDLRDDGGKTFTVEFLAYDYYWMGINCEAGIVIPYIIMGDHIIKLKELEGWWEKMTLDSWVGDLDNEIRLRIPDKYLMEKGWK